MTKARTRTVTELLPTTCGCSAIRRANRAVTQFYDLALAPTGMRATQFTMLQIIAEAGEISQCEFARQYSISIETLSRRFSGLRRKGWIAIRIADHFQRICNLTVQGQAALQAARPYWENAQARLRRELGEADWQSFLRACETAVPAAQEAAELKVRNGAFRRVDPPIELREGRPA